MKEHMKNGLAVARYLEKHPFVDKVVHPGKIYNDVFCIILSKNRVP